VYIFVCVGGWVFVWVGQHTGVCILLWLGVWCGESAGASLPAVRV